jgi:hypothetical protein
VGTVWSESDKEGLDFISSSKTKVRSWAQQLYVQGSQVQAIAHTVTRPSFPGGCGRTEAKHPGLAKRAGARILSFLGEAFAFKKNFVLRESCPLINDDRTEALGIGKRLVPRLCR